MASNLPANLQISPSSILRKRISKQSLRSLITLPNFSSISLPNYPTTGPSPDIPSNWHANHQRNVSEPLNPKRRRNRSSSSPNRVFISYFYTHAHYPATATSLLELPNELLIQCLSYLDIPSLFALYNVSSRLRQLTEAQLSCALESTILRLWFHQDGLRRTCIDYWVREFDPVSARLVFVCSPSTTCVFKSGTSRPQLDEVIVLSGPTATEKNAADNYLDMQCPLKIKKDGQGDVDGLRRSFGSTYPWRFRYVVEYVRANEKASMAAETKHRFVKPGIFECSLNFLDPKRGRKSLAVRWYASKFGETGSVTQWVKNQGKRWLRGVRPVAYRHDEFRQVEEGFNSISFAVPVSV